jgi:flagellar assembly protein FliH
MISCAERLTLSRPLRGVRFMAPGEAAREAAAEGQLRAEYERGRRDAEGALRQQLLQQRAEMLELRQGVLESLAQVVPRLRAECESHLVELALEAARKLVAGFPVDAALVETAVREALGQLEETQDMTVLLNSEDYVLLEKAGSSLLNPAGTGPRLTCRPDPEVSRGGCIVQTAFGTVDARRETKLECLRKGLAS